MERWEVRATPSSDDPDRHLLLIQGGPGDVASLLKKFGALMGRPAPAQVEGFNLCLVLHRLKPDAREKLDAWLRQMAPVRAPEPIAVVTPAAAPPPPPPPTPVPAPVPVPVVEAPPIPVLAAPPPPPPPMPVMPELKPPVVVPPVLDIPVPAPVLEPPAIPALKAPEPEKPALVPLAAEPPPPPPPPAPVPVPAPVVVAPVVAPPEPVLASVPPPTPGPAGYMVSVELRQDWAMDSLLVGAYNRFAHAAAMSVVTAPGTMYNPLFLFGVPGTGKSHLLNAVGSALSKGLGRAVLLSTSGSRLSRAVNSALARKSMVDIETKINNSKALLIDDIHLMAVSDQNKDALAKIFKTFFDRGQQVVITSLYPPKSLGALEEALKFSFSKGWSVDLKVPSPAVQKDLIAAAAERAGASLGADEIGLLHDKLSVWGYQDLNQWLKRIVVMKRIREAAGQPATLQTLMPLIFDPLQSGGAEAPKPGGSFTPPAVGTDAEPLAVIAPKGQDGLGAFVASIFYEVGSKNGFNKPYRHALWDTYDPTQPYGVPFLIGEMCARANVTRALIIGPMADSPLGPRAAEFAHATRRILDSFGVEMGWIPYNGLGLSAYYLDAHLDLARLPPKA
jgi:chromosomal replication initiator protein